jgi:hypothetical protein
MAKMSKKRDKDHDSFIRGILSIDELVKKLLKRYIPLSTQTYIDFSTLKIMSDMHMDSKLKSSQSDSIHEFQLKQDVLKKEVQKEVLPIFRFCFLWEHKSDKPGEPIESQVEKYRYSILQADLKNKQKPSIIIPIIIYNGKEKWANKMIYDQLAPYLPDDILTYVSHPKYIFIDLQAITDEAIAEMVELGELRAAFIALKHGYDKEFFKHDMEKILKFVDEMSPLYLFQVFFKMLLEYMQRRSELENEEFNDIVQQKLEPDMATKFKTIFEVAEEKALEKGKIEGKIEGMAIGEEKGKAIGEAMSKETLHKAISVLIRTTSLTDKQIAEELGAEESLVKSIRIELKKKN